MWIIILLFAVGVVLYYAKNSKSQKMWRILSRHPFAVVARIEDSPDWCITKREGKDVGEKPISVNWVGPFRLIIPDEGLMVFWGRAEVYEKQLADLASYIETGKVRNLFEDFKRQMEH